MKHSASAFLFLVIFLTCLTPLPAGEDIEVTANVSATKIGLDDALEYTIMFKGVQNPIPPELDGLKDFRLLGTSQSSEFQFINGVSSSFIRIHFSLMPKRTGMLTIPAFSFRYEGNEHKTSPFVIEVVQGSVQPPASGQGALSPFDLPSFPSRTSEPPRIDVRLKTEISKQKVLLGEQVIYKVLLYTINQINNITPLSKQSLPGFWQEWFPVPQSITGRRERIGKTLYQVFEIRRAALFPTRTGTLTIPPLEFQFNLVDNSTFFFNTRPVTRSTPKETIEVLPLPKSTENLPVGKFSFHVENAQKSIDINNLLSLKIVITGTGNMKTLTSPILTSTEKYTVFPPKISRSSNYNREQLHGTLTAELPISFKESGEQDIPALEFSYFDPEKRIPVTLQSQPISVSVQGMKSTVDAVQTVGQTGIIQKGEDILYIITGNVQNQQGWITKKNWITPLIFLPFLLNVLVLGKKWIWDRSFAGSRFYTQRRLLARTIKELQHLQQLDRITDTVDRFLVQRSHMGYSELSAQNIRNLLSHHKLSAAEIDRFFIIRNNAEFSRFSPQKSNYRELQKDIHEMIRLIRRIDSILP